MGTQKNVQIVKDFFAAMGRGDKQGLLALSAKDIEWIIPGGDWSLAGTHRGHAELGNSLQNDDGFNINGRGPYFQLLPLLPLLRNPSAVVLTWSLAASIARRSAGLSR